MNINIHVLNGRERDATHYRPNSERGHQQPTFDGFNQRSERSPRTRPVPPTATTELSKPHGEPLHHRIASQALRRHDNRNSKSPHPRGSQLGLSTRCVPVSWAPRTPERGPGSSHHHENIGTTHDPNQKLVTNKFQATRSDPGQPLPNVLPDAAGCRTLLVKPRGNRCQFVLPSGNCMNCSENPARNWPGGATIPPDPHEAPGVHCLRGGVLPWCRTRSMAQTSARRSTVTRTGRRRRASEDVARETFCSTCSPRVGGNNSGYAATSGPD